MKYSSSNIYILGLLAYQIFLISILNLINISPLCSIHIKLFLRIFIPTIMVGELILLRFIARQQSYRRKDTMSEAMLVAHGFVAFLIGSCFYHIIAVLLGASITDLVEETFSFACLCSALTVFPLYIAHESHWEDFVHSLPDFLDVRSSLLDALKFVAYSTVIGAWFGAFPIPLDWGRDWQTWPITCCVGAMSGNIIGLSSVLVISIGLVDHLSFWKWKAT